MFIGEANVFIREGVEGIMKNFLHILRQDVFIRGMAVQEINH
jgi:hypothetical protein